MTRPEEIWPDDDPIWCRMKRMSDDREPPMLDVLKRYDIEIAFVLAVVIAYAIGWCVCKYDSLD